VQPLRSQHARDALDCGPSCSRAARTLRALPPTQTPARRAAARRAPAAAPRAEQPARSGAGPAAQAAGEYPNETPLVSWDKISAEDIESWDEATGPPTPLLDTVEYPVHLKNFNSQQLKQLCKELRSDVVHTVSQTGGHLSSSLGVVELTVAMHYVFNAPDDKIIFDVGHQCYIHKMLTGRRKGMRSIRQTNGLSGAARAGRGRGVPGGAAARRAGGWARRRRRRRRRGGGWRVAARLLFPGPGDRLARCHPLITPPPTTPTPPQASPSAPRASTTPSARATAAPPSPRASAWRSAAT
jgi:hypothetical protein